MDAGGGTLQLGAGAVMRKAPSGRKRRYRLTGSLSISIIAYSLNALSASVDRQDPIREGSLLKHSESGVDGFFTFFGGTLDKLLNAAKMTKSC